MKRALLAGLLIFPAISADRAYTETRTLLSLSAPLAFELTEHTDEQHSTLSLRIISPVSVETSVVHHPERIVVDLPPVAGLRNRTHKGFNSSLLSTVRIGTHPDKARIVLDLSVTEAAELHSRKEGEDTFIDVTFRTDAAPATSVAPSMAPSPASTAVTSPSETPIIEAAEPRATPMESPAPVSEPASEPTIVPATPTEAPPTVPATIAITPEPTATHTPSPTVTSAAAATLAPAPTAGAANSAPASTGVRVRKFEYEYEGDNPSPVIRIRLDGKTAFKLSKTADKLYSLSIPSAVFGSAGLKLPQFPPRDFAGFTYLQGAVQENGVEVIIGVERGTRITATAQEQDILVRTVKPQAP